MESVEAGEISVEITLGSAGLNVGLVVLDDTDAAPAAIPAVPGMVNGVIPMLNFSGFSYRGKFPATAGRLYAVNKAVYTDNTFVAIKPFEPQGSETFQVRRPIVVGTQISGVIGGMSEIHGIIEDQAEVRGCLQD